MPNDKENDSDNVSKITRLATKVTASTTLTKSRLETLDDFDFDFDFELRKSSTLSSSSAIIVKEVMGLTADVDVHTPTIHDFINKAEDRIKSELIKNIVHPDKLQLNRSIDREMERKFWDIVPAFLYLEWVRETTVLATPPKSGCACCFNQKHKRSKCSYQKYKNIFITSMVKHLSTLITSCSIKAYSLQDKGDREGVKKYLRILDNMSEIKKYCRQQYYDVG